MSDEPLRHGPLQHVRRDRFPQVRPLLLDVYREIYASEDASFHSVGKFAERLDMYAALDGWEAVIGRTEENVVTGYTFGAPLPPGSGWWRSAAEPLPEGLTAENGRRTFAVFEIMVRAAWRGTGEAHRIHEALLAGRPEQRATLLVDTTHDQVRRRYEEWGYRSIGSQKPFQDAPVYVMMLRLLRT